MPGHRPAVTDSGAHRAVDAAVVTRRRTAVTAAGSALSLAGAGAAGWVAVTQIPNLLQVALQSENAPSARTITLLAADASVDAGSVAAATPAPVDAGALVGAAQAAAVAPRFPTSVRRPTPPPAPGPVTRAPSASEKDGGQRESGDDRDAGASDSGRSGDDSASAADDADSGDSGGSGSNGSGSNGNESNGNDSSGDDGGTTENPASGSDDDPDATGDSSGSASDGGSASNDEGSSSDEQSDSDTDASSDSSGSSTGGSGTSDSGSTTGSSSASGGSAGVDARTAPASTAAAPLAGAGARVAQALPSELLDTKDWYLTLPTGKEGDPDLVEGSALAKYHSQYYQLNESKDAVVFTAGTGGATTSGSEYPRSELREMAGSEKASWDGRKGRHTMEIVEAITQTPDKKPDVIAGQIHGTSDDLMQIHLSGQNLRVKYDDGRKFVDLEPNYRLGTMFSVKIESAEGRVKVWYNGQQKADLPISSSTSYFKAGVYTNSNPSKGDKSGEGQVMIRSLSVRHT
jgi:hypothetical protein